MVGRKVDENRVEYKQLMIESLLPPAQKVCSAAVHVENAIRYHILTQLEAHYSIQSLYSR